MGLIKRDQLEERGTVLIERKTPPPPPKKPKIVLPPVQSATKISPSAPVPAVPAGADLNQVRSEAQQIVDQAMNEAEGIKDEAREAGREEGRAEAAANIEESLETLNEAVKERKTIIKDAEQEILRLALKVAEQIIRSEVSMHRDVSLNIVAEAISRVSDREQIIVRVNRDDAEYLKRFKDRLAAMLDGVKSFSIIEDPNVEAGGCVIETNLGFIDAKIGTKIKSIETALKKVAAEEEQR